VSTDSQPGPDDPVATRSSHGPARTAVPTGDVVAVRVVRILAGIVLVLMGFRFVLALLAANPYNGFVHSIYSITWPLVSPFYGMFGYTAAYTPRLEVFTLFGMAVYALVAWGLMAVLRIRRPENA
jgi:hypothetical protein